MRGLRIPVLASVAALAFAVARPGNALAAECGDLLIVLDRSGSMVSCSIGAMTKEVIAKEALKAVTDAYSTVPMGLAVFPDTLNGCGPGGTGAGCVPGKIVIDVAADGARQLADWLAKMPKSCGGTPTGVTMEAVRDYPAAKWSAGREHYVLLLTDGQPTCEDGDNGAMLMGAKCVGGGPGIPCDGKGCCWCKNPTRSFLAIEALRARGIKTFVVGFGGGSGSTCNNPICIPDGKPFDPATLDKMAEAGGVPNEAGPTKFYLADDAKSLGDALTKIVGKVAGGTVGGCSKSGGTDGGGAGGGAADAGGGKGGSGGQDGGTSGPENPGGGARSAPGCVCSSVGAVSIPVPVVGAAIIATGFVLLRFRHRRRGQQGRIR